MLAQNGAPIIATVQGQPDYRSPLLTTQPIPGTGGIRFLGGLLKGDCDTVLRYVGAYWHHFIEPITEQVAGQWGYNLRPVKGQTVGYSNHSAGTAIDVNASRHPLGTRTLAGAQTTELARLTIILRGCVRFGAFYTNRPDEMHAELVVFGAPLARVADDIRRGRMETNFPELVTNPDPAPSKPAVTKPATSKPAASKPARPADWWDTVDEPQVRKIVSEEVAKVVASDGLSGAGDLGRLSAYLEPLVRKWVNEEATKVSESQGYAGSADRGATVQAFREAGILTPGVTDDQILSALKVALA